MSLEYCHHCDTYIDTDDNVEGEYNDITLDYTCEVCIEEREEDE